MAYQYEKGDHRVKHLWNSDKAGFVFMQGGHEVGKCPNNISLETAEALLNQAVAEPNPFALNGSDTATYPRRMYATYRGVIYEAVPTQPGSYHAYPWRARPGRFALPFSVVAHLREMATRQGYLQEFEHWLDQYG